MSDRNRQELWWYPASGPPYPVHLTGAPSADTPTAPTGPGMPVLDRASRSLTIVLLVASSLRVVAAVVGAGVGWGIDGRATYSQRIGNSLLTLGGFGDGQGLLLLVAAVALLLWLGEYRTSRAEPWLQPRTPPVGLALWTSVLLALGVLGALTYFVGTIMDDDGYSSTRVEWGLYVSSGGFALAYAVLGIGILVVLVRVIRSWTSQGQRSPVGVGPAGPPPGGPWPGRV
jgi:hypothetical protein